MRHTPSSHNPIQRIYYLLLLFLIGMSATESAETKNTDIENIADRADIFYQGMLNNCQPYSWQLYHNEILDAQGYIKQYIGTQWEKFDNHVLTYEIESYQKIKEASTFYRQYKTELSDVDSEYINKSIKIKACANVKETEISEMTLAVIDLLYPNEHTPTLILLHHLRTAFPSTLTLLILETQLLTEALLLPENEYITLIKQKLKENKKSLTNKYSEDLILEKQLQLYIRYKFVDFDLLKTTEKLHKHHQDPETLFFLAKICKNYTDAIPFEDPIRKKNVFNQLKKYYLELKDHPLSEKAFSTFDIARIFLNVDIYQHFTQQNNQAPPVFHFSGDRIIGETGADLAQKISSLLLDTISPEKYAETSEIYFEMVRVLQANPNYYELSQALGNFLRSHDTIQNQGQAQTSFKEHWSIPHNAPLQIQLYWHLNRIYFFRVNPTLIEHSPIGYEQKLQDPEYHLRFYCLEAHLFITKHADKLNLLEPRIEPAITLLIDNLVKIASDVNSLAPEIKQPLSLLLENFFKEDVQQITDKEAANTRLQATFKEDWQPYEKFIYKHYSKEKITNYFTQPTLWIPLPDWKNLFTTMTAVLHDYAFYPTSIFLFGRGLYHFWNFLKIQLILHTVKQRLQTLGIDNFELFIKQNSATVLVKGLSDKTLTFTINNNSFTIDIKTLLNFVKNKEGTSYLIISQVKNDLQIRIEKLDVFIEHKKDRLRLLLIQAQLDNLNKQIERKTTEISHCLQKKKLTIPQLQTVESNVSAHDSYIKLKNQFIEQIKICETFNSTLTNKSEKFTSKDPLSQLEFYHKQFDRLTKQIDNINNSQDFQKTESNAKEASTKAKVLQNLINSVTNKIQLQINLEQAKSFLENQYQSKYQEISKLIDKKNAPTHFRDSLTNLMLKAKDIKINDLQGAINRLKKNIDDVKQENDLLYSAEQEKLQNAITLKADLNSLELKIQNYNPTKDVKDKKFKKNKKSAFSVTEPKHSSISVKPMLEDNSPENQPPNFQSITNINNNKNDNSPASDENQSKAEIILGFTPPQIPIKPEFTLLKRTEYTSQIRQLSQDTRTKLAYSCIQLLENTRNPESILTACQKYAKNTTNLDPSELMQKITNAAVFYLVMRIADALRDLYPSKQANEINYLRTVFAAPEKFFELRNIIMHRSQVSEMEKFNIDKLLTFFTVTLGQLIKSIKNTKLEDTLIEFKDFDLPKESFATRDELLAALATLIHLTGVAFELNNKDSIIYQHSGVFHKALLFYIIKIGELINNLKPKFKSNIINNVPPPFRIETQGMGSITKFQLWRMAAGHHKSFRDKEEMTEVNEKGQVHLKISASNSADSWPEAAVFEEVSALTLFEFCKSVKNHKDALTTAFDSLPKNKQLYSSNKVTSFSFHKRQ